MTIKYLAVFRDDAGEPAVTGEWTDGATALRMYRGWVGLYGDSPSAVIRLIAQTGDHQSVLKTWTKARGEVEGAGDTRP